MRYYPLFLDLQDRPILVVGAGNVGIRKAKGALAAGARVTVVAPAGVPGMEVLRVRWLRRRFRVSDLKGKALAFAATNDRAVNRKIADAAKHLGILVNVADAPEECDFLVPSRLEVGGVQVAISTEGRSPRLAAAIRRELECILETPDVPALSDAAGKSARRRSE